MLQLQPEFLVRASSRLLGRHRSLIFSVSCAPSPRAQFPPPLLATPCASSAFFSSLVWSRWRLRQHHHVRCPPLRQRPLAPQTVRIRALYGTTLSPPCRCSASGANSQSPDSAAMRCRWGRSGCAACRCRACRAFVTF